MTNISDPKVAPASSKTKTPPPTGRTAQEKRDVAALPARPTTLVESDQLAQAAVNILRNEDFVPRGKRWPFSRSSKAQRDYDKAVQEITTRRRTARQNSVEQAIKKALVEADATLERAKNAAEAEHKEKIAEARQPYSEKESKARNERDAAIAAANRAYQEAMDAANRLYDQEAAVLDQKRTALVSEAEATHDKAYASIEAKREAEAAQIAKDLKTIPLEGPMRVVEDRQAWSVEDRKKALIGIIDMAGREDHDTEYAELCLRSIAGYVFQDRFLKPDAQQHRLMDANLLEALVELARRTASKRPTVVRYMHSIVMQNPGHSSPAFIKGLTELYVIASTDTTSIYAQDPVENEQIFDTMRDQIADALKLTPRRSQVPPPASDATSTADASGSDDEHKTPVMTKSSDADITADVDFGDLFLLETGDSLGTETDAIVQDPARPNAPASANRPPKPPPRRGKGTPPSDSN